MNFETLEKKLKFWKAKKIYESWKSMNFDMLRKI